MSDEEANWAALKGILFDRPDMYRALRAGATVDDIYNAAELDLPADAGLDQVRAAHRRLARQHHPDKGGDPARFRRVQSAYEALTAALKRRTRIWRARPTPRSTEPAPCS